MAQREEIIQRTAYVSDIDQQRCLSTVVRLWTAVFLGTLTPYSVFPLLSSLMKGCLEFVGTMLGFYPVRLLPPKTAIAPVNPTFFPRVTQSDVKLFFESVCREVYRLRLLGDYHRSTRIAFVEIVMAESAIAGLNCSGVILGSLPIRVSPSKTPVRPRAPRLPMY